jgi:hypothetical protein
MQGAPAAVKIFSEEKPVYWREAASGHNRLAYFLGKSIASIYRIVLTNLHFTAIFYVLATPLTPFDQMYSICFMFFYCVYGLANIVSMLTRRENAPLLAVVASLFAAVFGGFGPTLTDAADWGIGFLWDMGYARWGSEALYHTETLPFVGIYILAVDTSYYGYTLGRFTLDMVYMFINGSILRVISLILLLVTNRDKQK